jgi:hypothetical protein
MRLGKESVMTAARVSLVLGLAVLAAACGGEGGMSRESSSPRPRPICEEYDRRSEDVQEPQSVEDVERYVSEIRPLVEEGLNELRELEPPAELEERWDELMAKNEESLEVLDDLREAGANSDEARIEETAAEAMRQDEESDRIARDIGLQKCGADDDVTA